MIATEQLTHNIETVNRMCSTPDGIDDRDGRGRGIRLRKRRHVLNA